MIKKTILVILITLISMSIQAKAKTYKMVFVPASEKGDENVTISTCCLSVSRLPLEYPFDLFDPLIFHSQQLEIYGV